jgi:hypothetical protein
LDCGEHRRFRLVFAFGAITGFAPKVPKMKR